MENRVIHKKWYGKFVLVLCMQYWVSTSYYVKKKKKIQFIPIPLTHACISCTMYYIMFDYRWTLEDEETNQISALEPTKLLVKADSTWASSLKVKYNVISLWPVKRQRQRQWNFKDRKVVAHQKVNSATLHQICL